ncbi:MAG: metalloregulator ArsR/SmtB family transcription factor [Gemmatimonadaceae bacterium]
MLQSSAGLDATFAALADPTRRAILARLATGEASVMELAQPFSISQPAVSRHLKVLESAGLISRGRDAQWRPAKLEAGPLAEVADWLSQYEQFWDARLNALDTYLKTIHPRSKPNVRKRK